MKGDIDAASWGAARIDVFGLGAANSEAYQATYVATWTPWEALSAGTAFTLGMAASSPAAQRLWLFATGSDAALWSRYWNGTVWSAWATLGGGLTSAPDATSTSNATWSVVRGTDTPARMYIIKNTGNLVAATAWAPFTVLPALATGSTFASGPCISAWSDTRIDVFARGGATGSVWHNYSTDAGTTWVYPTWEDWGGGGNLASDPDCVAWANGRIDLVARGSNNHIWHQFWQGSAFSVWEDLGVY